ncbi:RNA polymerase [Cladochytrium replicatum]|nr:RNA polymerase [Cladochytrium replicatum]
MADLDQGSKDAARLWKIYRTLHEMVYDRGYLVSEDELNMTLEEFKYAKQSRNGEGTIDRADLQFLVQKQSPDDPEQLLVLFAPGETLRISDMKKIYARMEDHKISRAIVVCQKAPTPQSNKVIQEMADRFTLELFQENELLVNITKHSLVPKHEVLSPEEKKVLLKKYRLKEMQLPRIQPSDPISRYYGLKKQSVVRIIRPSETAGK